MIRRNDERSVPLREETARKKGACLTLIIPKEEPSSRIQKAERHFREFCDKTSLHALQYLGEPHRLRIERICWFLAILVSVVCCALVIRKQWNKWNSSPVIVTFAETSMPVWDIPFPAVTICPEVKFVQSDFNYTELLFKDNKTEQEENILEYSSVICYLHNGIKRNETMDEGVYDFIVNVAPDMSRILQSCKWRGTDYRRCDDLFSTTITDEGVCYTFNMLVNDDLFNDHVGQAYLTDNEHLTKHWNLETMYDTREDLNDTYPWRTMSSGTKAGLSVFLEAQDLEVDGNCRIPIKGFKMMLHSPGVFPIVSDQFIRVPSKKDVVIGVHPKIIRTSEDLTYYSPQDRKCFFQNEKQLHFFRNYTQENCEIECLTNYTLAMCNCVLFYMPRHNGTPICGDGTSYCTDNIRDVYTFDSENHNECDCLPSCTEIKYDVDTTQASYMWGKFHKKLKNKTYGTFTIFFRDMQTLTMKRTELFGATDFLANCGGILGLFLGFSALSFVEIIYFLSLRIYGNNHPNRR